MLDVISELNGEPYYLLLGEGIVEAVKKDYDDDEEASEDDVTDDSKSAIPCNIKMGRQVVDKS